MSKDMMRAFELYQPESVENAVDLMGQLGPQGWAMGGGNDTLDWFKDRAKYAPSVPPVAIVTCRGGAGFTNW